MGNTDNTHFRFMDLPAELRNKVYSNLLCSFKAPDSNVPLFARDPKPLTKAKHSIDTTILLTNSQIHREAYDVMLKRNRFTLVRSTSKFPLHTILANQRVPVVTANARCISHFKGYLLELRLSAKKHIGDSPHLKRAMILACDLEVFCRGMISAGIRYKGFSEVVIAHFYMAPTLDHKCPRYQDSLHEFISEKIQKALFEPFTTSLYGFKNVKVIGHVLPELAESTKTDLGEDEFVDTTKVLEMISAIKEEGKVMFHNGQIKNAYLHWSTGMFQLTCIHCSSSWNVLLAKGDDTFVEKVAELQLTLCLNLTHAGIMLSSYLGGITSTNPRFWIDEAYECFRPDWWKKGYTYQTSDTLLAKLKYREAMFVRMWGEVEEIPIAISCISHALQLLPDDPKIKEEQRLIMKMMDELCLG